MNVGFFIDNLNGDQENLDIYKLLDEGVETHKLTDAALFYNNIDHNPHQGKFGQFNSTDIWFFTGKLIATTLRNLGIAHNAVNKFDLFYLFDEKDKDPLSLLGFAGSIPVIAKTKEDGKRYYRLTGIEPKTLEEFTCTELLKAVS
jgi:hypothetical protein